jgi:hypothetical protein
MIDRELLELAAKAAGMNGTAADFGDRLVFLPDGSSDEWNPLTDDGDALRLAVTLGFINPGQWPCAGYAEADRMLKETGNVDWYAVTRRSIVRAAAAIGESK